MVTMMCVTMMCVTTMRMTIVVAFYKYDYYYFGCVNLVGCDDDNEQRKSIAINNVYHRKSILILRSDDFERSLNAGPNG